VDFIFLFLCDLHRLNSLTAIIIVYISSNLNVRRRSRRPFLMLEDIDEVWEEMIESKPDISATCHFPRDLWNMFDT
jgi:hypothetical protein